MEFNETEFLERLEKATTGEEIRKVIESIPLTQEDLYWIKKMDGRDAIITELKTI